MKTMESAEFKKSMTIGRWKSWQQLIQSSSEFHGKILLKSAELKLMLNLMFRSSTPFNDGLRKAPEFC
jgi:hypothetical protein